jgi:hypothetical protein
VISQEDGARLMDAGKKMAQKYAPAVAAIALGHPDKRLNAAYLKAEKAFAELVAKLTESEGL